MMVGRRRDRRSKRSTADTESGESDAPHLHTRPEKPTSRRSWFYRTSRQRRQLLKVSEIGTSADKGGRAPGVANETTVHRDRS